MNKTNSEKILNYCEKLSKINSDGNKSNCNYYEIKDFEKNYST